MKNDNKKYQASTGVNQPYVETSKVIDPETNKPLEFIHQKAYHNIDVSTGWEVAPDGRENYSIDISLQDYDKDGNITIMYSPEAKIPVNKNDSTCDRDNFPDIRTIEMNKIRLYAKRIPTAGNMPRITIVVSEIGTSVGDTGAREKTSDRDGGIILDKVVIELKKDNFTLPLDSENQSLRRTTIVLNVSAKKADKYVSVSFGNLESENFFRNMDGSSAKLDKNDKKITYEVKDGVDKPGSLEVTIPKGYILKDGMGYFIIPVTANRRVYWLYANLYSEEHENLSQEKSSFFIDFPRMSRNTLKDVYYINGEVFSRSATVLVRESRPSGYEGKPSGVLRIFDLTDGSQAVSIFETSVVSGQAIVNNLTQFNNYDELRVVFYQDNQIKANVRTKIVTKEGDVEIETSENYLTPLITSTSYVVNSLKVSLYSRFSSGLRDIYYGYLKVTTDAGEVVYESNSPGYSFSIPQKTYNSKTLPFKYNIEVFQAKGSQRELIQRRVIVIHKEGDLQIVPSIEVTPASLVIPVNKDHEIIDGPHSFKVRVKQQGEYLDLNKWSITAENSEPDLKIKTDDHGNFVVESFTGRKTYAEVIIKVAEKGDDIENYHSINYGITKNNIMDNLGDFVFVKYGNLRYTDGVREYSFTIDPNGILPDGEAPGPYYGIAATHGDGGAPQDPKAYIWTKVAEDNSVPGSQEVGNQEFYIDGPTSINIVNNNFDPEIARYTIKSLNSYTAKEIKWQVRNIASGRWIDFSPEDLTHRLDFDTERITVRFSNKLFDQNQRMSIKAIVKAETEDGEKDFPVIFNSYSVRNSTIFGQIKTLGRENESFHIFPRDRYNNTISGTKRSTDMVILTADFKQGKNKLLYNETPGEYTYSVLDGPHFTNCSLDVQIIDNQFTLGFDYISGENGKISITFGVGVERIPIKVEYLWGTKLIADNRRSGVDMQLNRDHFTINSATPTAMKNWEEVYNQYEENFVNENTEDIEIYFKTVNTNVKEVLIEKNFGNKTSLATKLTYANDELDFFPISILEKDNNIISGTTVPGEIYFLVADDLANKKIKFLRADNSSVEPVIKNNHVFVVNGSQKAIIFKAPPGAERIELDFEQPRMALYLLPVSNSLRLLVDRPSSFEEHILLTNADQVRRRIPKSFKINNNLVSYRINPINLRGYVAINPKMAVSLSFFSSQVPDITTNVLVETVTGDSQLRTLSRIVRNYEDLVNFDTQISTIAGKKFITQQDVSYLANSREAIRMARESLISRLGEATISINKSEPEEEYAESLFQKVGDYYLLEIDKTIADPDVSNTNSILGFHMKDRYFNVIKFKLRYSGDEPLSTLTNNFKIYNKSLLDKYDDRSEDLFSDSFSSNDWEEYILLTPPASESLEQIDLELEHYLISEGITSNIENVKVIYPDRKINKNESATYYIDLSIDHSDPNYEFLVKDDLEMRDIEVLQLNLAEIKENKLYNMIINDSAYTAFKGVTLDYMTFIKEVETTFKEDKKGMLETDTLSHNIYDFFNAANNSIQAVEKRIAELTHQDVSEMALTQFSDGLKYTVGVANSSGMISSLQISPEGTMLKGDKNQVIGSTSIGNLYGKKIVIGKEITDEDVAYDKELIKRGDSEGTIAIWDKNKWASVMNKKGQYYLRYDGTKDSTSLVGYMVMDPTEIAAYQFDMNVTTGFSSSKPLDVEDTNLVGVSKPVFQIDKDGIVKASKLYIGEMSGAGGDIKPSIDLMNRVRIQAYESEDNKNKYRRGIVFLSINQGGN